jgi:hypothetical protein
MQAEQRLHRVGEAPVVYPHPEFNVKRITSTEKIKQLTAIIARLPQCRGLRNGRLVQGVPVVPGSDTLWRINATGEAEESINWDGWGVKFFSDLEPDGYWLKRDTRDCYDTRKAAEVAGDGLVAQWQITEFMQAENRVGERPIIYNHPNFNVKGTQTGRIRGGSK